MNITTSQADMSVLGEDVANIPKTAALSEGADGYVKHQAAAAGRIMREQPFKQMYIMAVLDLQRSDLERKAGRT